MNNTFQCNTGKLAVLIAFYSINNNYSLNCMNVHTYIHVCKSIIRSLLQYSQSCSRREVQSHSQGSVSDGLPQPIQNKGIMKSLMLESDQTFYAHWLSICTFQKTELVKYCMNDETATVGASSISGSEDGLIDPRTNLLRQRQKQQQQQQQQQQGRRQPPRGFNPVRVNVNDLAQELRFRNFV